MMAHDPTRTRKSADAANHYAARLLQHLVVPTFVIDADRRVVVWNRACERLTGVPATEVLGTRNHWQGFYEDDRYCLADLVALGRQDLIGDLYSEFVATKDDSVGSSAENWCVMPRLGNHLYLAIDAGPIHDDDGNLIAVVETLRDMTDQKRAEMALKTLAAKDALTGLANRRSFDQAIEMEWSRADRSGRPLALLFADVDHFKLFNDNHGHQRGDECLRDIAGIIGKTAIRPTDLATRYGGEEFAIIMPDTDMAAASAVAERLRHAVAEMRIALGEPAGDGCVTLSVGVATYVPGQEVVGPDWLIGQADQALYAAKHLGRNRVVTTDNMLLELAKARLTRAAAAEPAQPPRKARG
ncbi:MAG TPA: diguanylate cyclase [Bradyrhizobium sp.]|nr:diguanylate cyclase [Bradyrhizobium sp.]